MKKYNWMVKRSVKKKYDNYIGQKKCTGNLRITAECTQSKFRIDLDFLDENVGAVDLI